MLDATIYLITLAVWLLTTSVFGTAFIENITEFKPRDWNWLMIGSSLVLGTGSMYVTFGYSTPYVPMLDMIINVQFSWMFLITAGLILWKTEDNRKTNKMIYEAP
mgnify:FL=1|jgi:hypothetical protein